MKKKNVSAPEPEARPLPLKTIMALSCVAMFTLTTLLSQLYVVLDSNYLTRNELLLFVINVINTDLFENITFAIVYSVIIYSAVIYSTKKLLAVCGIYLGLSTLRRAVSVLLTLITSRGLDIELDIVNPLIYLAIEAIQMLLVALVSASIGNAYKERLESKKKAALRTGSLYNDASLNFNTVLSKENPLQICALIAGIMLSAIKVGMRISYDVTYIIVLGAPEGAAEIILMCAYYLSDVLVAALVYAASWLILRAFVRKDTTIN